MISFQTRRQPCSDCRIPSECIVWHCPTCGVYRWLDEWEGYDDVTACPVCDEIHEYAAVVGDETLRLCRVELIAAAELEVPKQRERRLFA